MRWRADRTGAALRSVALWQPFTARSIGWREEDLPGNHSRPHVAALAHLHRELGVQTRIEYLTDGRLPRASTIQGSRWWFWPASARFRKKGRQFRSEWSLLGLLRAALAPADVTIINTSGHGGGFARAIGRVVAWRGRRYVAMAAGFHATFDGAQRPYLEQASFVAVHNEDLRTRAIEAGLPEDRVVLVPLGVDTEAFTPSGSPRRPTVLYVGRIEEWKGVHLLVEAAAEVRVRHPEVSVELVGPESDPGYAERIRRSIEEAGVREVVQLRPPVAHRDLPELFARSSLLVLPSTGEGFGMVVVEAMACGVPVVALDRPGGPQDTITDGVDGRLVERGDLGRAIADLLDDPEDLSAMGAAARRTVLDRYSQEVTNRAFEVLTGSVPGGPGRDEGHGDTAATR